MQRLFVWMVEGKINKQTSLLLTVFYMLANGLVLYQRSLEVWDDKLFWFPIALAGIYFGSKYVLRPVDAKNIEVTP